MNIIDQTPATKILQFKLYATKFPVWWTHNSIDKPDPDYFKKLDLATDDTGFNWVEVPFTFNFKDQFTGTIVADDQYYTMFKLVDSKDTKYPNKYYLVESLNKAFNGGYELEIRLDVFTTYGLDFWVNGVKNPDISSKTVNLNRTNHTTLLYSYYYNYSGPTAGDFSIWTYKDPLLDFSNMPTVSAVASYMAITQDKHKYSLPPIPIDGILPVEMDNTGGIQLSPKPLIKESTNIVVNGRNIDITSENLTGLFSGSVRYYVFKNIPIVGLTANVAGRWWPKSSALNPVYTAFYTVSPNLNADNSLPWLNGAPVNSPARYKQLSIHERGTSIGYNRNICSAPDLLLWLMDNSSSFASNFVGVFEGPPLWAFSKNAYCLTADNQKYNYMVSHKIFEITNMDISFLTANIQITPSQLSNSKRYSPPNESNLISPNYFSIFSLSNYGEPPNINGQEDYKLSNNYQIKFIDISNDFNITNNAYILQKAQVQDLNFQPFDPAGIFSSFNIDWEDDLKNKGYSLPKRILATVKIPNAIYFNQQGFRFGYLNNNINMDLSLWTLPGMEQSGIDAYSQYITGALINQNTSMAIAKQQTNLNLASTGFNGAASIIGGIFSGDSIFKSFGKLFNFGVDMAKPVLAYRNKQKEYDAQNSANRATMGYSINMSTDKDSASNLVSNNLFQYNNSWWGYIALTCFNWMIPIKMPALFNDIIYYNNLVYLNGFYINCPTSIGTLLINWGNGWDGILPHLYYDIDIGTEVLKYHFKTLNLDLLNAITVLFNNGVRFWKNIPDYTEPWYWLPVSK